MKTAIIISNGLKQIMLTPESDEERTALKLITINDDISVEIKNGHFYDTSPSSAAGYIVRECQGGYLRAYDSAESVMLVLRPKSKCS